MEKFKDEAFKVSSFTWYGEKFTCVAVAIGNESVAVRNSNDPTKNTINFTKDEWHAFVSGVKNDEFNA